MDTFNYMRAFRRIVELGSLAKAAEDLDMSAGLSKQLRALESHLGAVLIQRTTRKMSLTDTGTAYYAECCRLLDELDALEKSVRRQSQRVSGELRVNAPLSFALSVLSPLLARFLRQYRSCAWTCPWKTAWSTRWARASTYRSGCARSWTIPP